MKKLLFISFIALFNINNAQALVYSFDGVLDLYTGSTLTDSASVTGDFSFIGEAFNSDFTGTFRGNLFGLPVSGDLTIPSGIENPVFSPLTITWNSNLLSNDLLLQISFTSLDIFQITTFDGDSDGVPGTVFSSGPKQSSSLAVSGRFSAVPLPSTFWLFGSGAIFVFGVLHRQTRFKYS